jgi:hypothetical protein
LSDFISLQLIALPSIIIGRNFTIVWEAMRNYQMTHNGELPASMESPRVTGTISHERRDSFIDDIPHFPSVSYVARSDDRGRDRLAEQVSALSEMTRQNQLAIERILRILETPHAADTRPKSDYSSPATSNVNGPEQNLQHTDEAELLDKELK